MQQMALSYSDIKNNAYQFAITYTDAVKENSEAQSFLNDFFAIFGVHRRRVATFEASVRTDGTGNKRIDLLWPGKLLVEMKSTGQNLDKAYKQGISYFKGLKDHELPRYVMVCDLNDFRLYDLDDGKDYRFNLSDLHNNLNLFDFMQGNEIEDITEFDLNEKAAELLGTLHDTLEESGYTGHQLQIFMVRILFILFAEDTGVFNRHQFTRYLMHFTDDSGNDTDMHLSKLFQVLDKSDSERNLNLTDELKAFPYVNGHLFKERIDMPSFTSDMREQLLQCCLFNWKDISPAIFGSLFQSIMDKEARRNLGAHYTSEANILKLIEPLFLNVLKDEFNKANNLKQNKTRNDRLIALMNKVRSLRFLDPACGCGNFLIITYRELRRIELQIMQAQQKNEEQGHFAIDIEPQINLNHFYGIEIDEWPARIAEVAMWLTQHQMNLEFAKSFGREPDLLPLKEHANIHNADALTTDWGDIIKPDLLSYIIGNPPFLGKQYRSNSQNKSMEKAFGTEKNYKNLDFVASWFYKAAQFVNSSTDIAFVATNSISMGEQVGILWQPLLDLGYKIHFAHRTFQWHNDAKGKAAVHCIIVGFGKQERVDKWIFDYPDIKGEPVPFKANNIAPYLVDGSNLVFVNRNKPLGDVPNMLFGSMPNDGGHLLLTSDERAHMLSIYPEISHWVKPILGAKEFLNGDPRYCLWLNDCGVKQLRELLLLPEIKVRIDSVKKIRSSSSRVSTQKLADTPWLFGEVRQPKTGRYILVPSISSQRRKYVPMGFFDCDVISSNKNLLIPGASLFEFGILTSNMHMDWMRTVVGRLKSDYQYSIKLVYNNFMWPDANADQCEKIEGLAQKILDARQLEVDKDSSTTLADLYDPDLMPSVLRKAHNTLDKAVDALYRKEPFKTPLDRVKHLFELYEMKTNQA